MNEQDDGPHCAKCGEFIQVTDGMDWDNETDWCYTCLLNEVGRLRRGLEAVCDLINSSRGVVGLHRNGDEAPWEELRKGGRFEEWLRDFDEALEGMTQ